MESTADEIGYDDPLALKMGQILARRAAAATRAISGSSRRSSRHSSVASGRRSVDSNGRRSSILDVVGEGSKPVESKRDSALLLPPPVVVDDRSPQEGSSRFGRVPRRVKGLQQQRQSPPGAHDLLNTFTFPSVPRPLSPPTREPESESLPQPSSSHFAQPSSHFGSQPPSHFGTSASTNANMPSYQLHIQTRVPLTVQTNLDPYSDQDPAPVSPVMFHEDARSVSFVMHGSPTSGVYVSPVESMSPTSLRFSMIERSFEALAAGERENFASNITNSNVPDDNASSESKGAGIPYDCTSSNVPHDDACYGPFVSYDDESTGFPRCDEESNDYDEVSAVSFRFSLQSSLYHCTPELPLDIAYHSSPYQNSPTGGRFPQHSSSNSRLLHHPASQSPSDLILGQQVHSSPATSYSQPSPNTPFQSSIPIAARRPERPCENPPSSNKRHTHPASAFNAHLDLLRGLSPLPSHGLPLPAPMRNP
ncbi:mucin 2, oligomeric mucus/gel-forming [Rhizoctonia solani]|uniref:Mucin 2, oligomeric mucus/gel-forming n=1 Tax=Rhizoctonia solani TaxID=456999 RepID=A0A8H8P4H4_9AGAM|nr:mucin 2, oligomeric mucus/gel-forming [Rhizoctonia solani]QRW25369.1 mucin 2, oligomeric mucus/gel-forming [Rhizoctonia solani]